AASIWARSAARPRGSPKTASKESRSLNIPNSAWKRSGASRSRTSLPSSSSTTRATTSSRNSISADASGGDGYANEEGLQGAARGGQRRNRGDLAERGGEPGWRRNHSLRRPSRPTRARARRQDTRIAACASRHARILDRPRKPLPQAGLFQRQDLRLLLRRGLAFLARNQDRARHGTCSR